MFERIKQIIVKEFTIWLRNRRMRFFLIGPPLIQLFLFGYVANMDVKELKTVIVDKDLSYETRELKRMLEASNYFKVVHSTFSSKEAVSFIEKGKATLIIEIEHGFSKKIKKGKEAKIQVIIDGTDSNLALIGRSYIGLIVERFAKQNGKILEPIFFDLKLRAYYNPDLKSRNFFLPGIVALIITLTSLLLTSISIVWERETGTMEQLIVTPLKPFELIIGKSIPAAIVGFFDMALVTGFSVGFFEVPLKGSLLFLFLYTSIYIFCMIGIGLFISTISRNLQQAIMATFLFFQPAVLLSGFATPIESMPTIFQFITHINPLKYYLLIVRGVFLKGSNFSDLLDELLSLFAIAFFIFFGSFVRLKKRLE